MSNYWELNPHKVEAMFVIKQH